MEERTTGKGARGFFKQGRIGSQENRKGAGSTLQDYWAPAGAHRLVKKRLGSTLDTAMKRFVTPEIFNTDQGAQFTSEAFTEKLLPKGIRISMDGKGRALDNVVVERFWRSLKYEEVYLKEYNDVKECRAGIAHYIEKYNGFRPHSSTGGRLLIWLIERHEYQTYFLKKLS